MEITFKCTVQVEGDLKKSQIQELQKHLVKSVMIDYNIEEYSPPENVIVECIKINWANVHETTQYYSENCSVE